ncbi:MAG: 3'-5' exonuclease [Burkholderiaceae bacterium]|nr:3'-5' exonuclease [Burkholderiaceae bacterium]
MSMFSAIFSGTAEAIRERLRTRPALDPALEDRLQALTELSPPPTRDVHRRSRYVTVDVETTGLDMHRDKLVSIGAVAVQDGLIDLAGCFELVLRQDASSSNANILIHRIGGQRQLAGVERAEALIAFMEYVAHAPLVAYRAEFDRTVLDRALKETLGLRTLSRWIDLAELLPALYPGNENRTMDDWLATMNIRMIARHDALADALATAQMLQVCLNKADALQMTCPQHLIEMTRAQHWLGKR